MTITARFADLPITQTGQRGTQTAGILSTGDTVID